MIPSQDMVDNLWGFGAFLAALIVFALVGLTVALVAKKWGK